MSGEHVESVEGIIHINVEEAESSSHETIRDSTIPSFRAYPKEWFEFFDDKHGGILTKEDLIQGLIYTFDEYDVDKLNSIVDNLWEILEHDKAGAVSVEEFMAPGGLHGTLVDNIPAHQRIVSPESLRYVI